MKVALFGASGFVGSHVSSALDRRGVEVVTIPAPRLDSPPGLAPRETVMRVEYKADGLAEAIVGCEAAIIASGDAGATSGDFDRLLAANAVSPALIAMATRRANVHRLIHVSSAAVQGDIDCLDSSPRRSPLTPYASSKAAGEELVTEFGPLETVIYRPGGVHGAERSVTRRTVRLALSPWSSVAGRGEDNTPQALVFNVADAIAYLATCRACPPAVVHHPSEGLTTKQLLLTLSDREPRSIPIPLARRALRMGRSIGRSHAKIAGNVRRVHMLWFGQQQATSWLDRADWEPPLGHEAWSDLAARVRDSSSANSRDELAPPQ